MGDPGPWHEELSGAPSSRTASSDVETRDCDNLADVVHANMAQFTEAQG